MWKTVRRYSIVASVALNAAFVAIWIAYAAASQPHSQQTGETTTQEQAIWCPLHRELDVTEEQWAQIEPRLTEFQAGVAELRQRVQAIRPEVIDLIAAEEPDLEAIRTKQDEILATKREIQGLVVGHLIAEKQVLTPDQQTQLFKMLREQSGCRVGPPMSGQGIRSGAKQVVDDRRDGADAGGTR
jgi:Spy/CpxP family protein refolding chaperone